MRNLPLQRQMTVDLLVNSSHHAHRNLNLDSDQKPSGRTWGSTVRYSDVQIREFEVVAGDNPCVSSGVAVEVRI